MAGTTGSMFRARLRRAIILSPLAGVVFAAVAAFAQAPDFPRRTIKIIVGPSPDVIVRGIAQHLQKAWGHPVVVEPRPGAGGQIAATAVASAEPDGHTVLFATPSYTINTALKTASYDLLKDFAPAVLFGVGGYALVVRPNLEAKSVAELIALAKSRPGKLNCASAGIGTVPHLACEALNTLPGVNVVHVPYRGVNEAMNGILANQVDMFVSVSAAARGQIEAGAVRGLAVTSQNRLAHLPQLPTLAESGYPDLVMSSWGGFLAPARTPAATLEKWNAEVRQGIQDPGLKEQLAGLGLESPPPLDVSGFTEFVKSDIARWTALVEKIGRDKLVPK